jgi:hypothetical protein
MHLNKVRLLALLTGAALIAVIPALGQDKPESILPPGFGDPVETPAPSGDSKKPTDLLPDVSLNSPTSSNDKHSLNPKADDLSVGLATANDGEEQPTVAQAVLQDLPASVRRSTTQVGILGSTDGDLGADAFGSADGKYLEYLMRKTRAPIASRWASIALRRALLSRVNTPGNLNGADWVAERAWLLLRMGEASAAQMLVQSVDVDQYSPKMLQVAMQTSLANSDPAGLCAYAEPGLSQFKDVSWKMARAICSALAGESAQASAQIDDIRDRGAGRGIDGLLAEKVVGAGNNTRRSVVIQWDGVSELTAWRFGLASATALNLPDALIESANPRVRAWQARSPLIASDKRERSAEISAALGVFSSAALIDFYGQIADETDPAASRGKPFSLLREAYIGDTPVARVAAMHGLWTGASKDVYGPYARLLATSYAAGRLDPNDGLSADADNIVASMMAAGLDIQAAGWAGLVSNGSPAWAYLAVGAPGKVVDWSRGKIAAFQSGSGGKSGRRGQFLFAGMAGLGRMDQNDVVDMASDMAIPIGHKSVWTRALDRAVAAHETGTVVLLCALGLQGKSWQQVSPVMLYHSISALRRVGLPGEARMIAAEAITRG